MRKFENIKNHRENQTTTKAPKRPRKQLSQIIENTTNTKQEKQQQKQWESNLKKTTSNLLFGNTLVLCVAFVLCVVARHPFVPKSVVFFCLLAMTKSSSYLSLAM